MPEVKTYVTIFGLGGWWIDGDWPLWLTLLLSSGVFTWIAHRITHGFPFLKP